MVCDSNLAIYKEMTSSPALVESFWPHTDPSSFPNHYKYHISDDHTALQAAGIPSMLLIDFDYPYYDTDQDSAEKCSPASLESVGTALTRYLYSL